MSANEGTASGRAPLAYGEERVNSYSIDHQYLPSVAVLADGSYVAVWQSAGQDASEDGVFLQRFASNGVALGAETRVNSATAGDQEYPKVAALSDGGFVVVWQDNYGVDGSDWSVQAQVFGADGSVQGQNFTANTTTIRSQYHGVVSGYNGGFAIAWASFHSGVDVYFKRYSNDGVEATPETLVSTAIGSGTAQPGAQMFPGISADDASNIVIVWHDESGNDGAGNGVFGQRWDAATQQLMGTFLVNTTTVGNQSDSGYSHSPRVAHLSNGDFVVVWPSDSNDGSGWTVMGQRFSSLGQEVGNEFVVNNLELFDQFQPDVTALAGGGFVVAFHSSGNDASGSGSYNDVYVREFDAEGMPRGEQRKLDMATAGGGDYEERPAVAGLRDGGFVVVYEDYVPRADGGNGTEEISQQIFGDHAGLSRSRPPLITGLTSQAVVGENTANVELQAIDLMASISDPDSVDFDGGRLDLYHLRGGSRSDQLGVRHQGSGQGQIGLSGATVSYEGVPIGTLSGGLNGANLVVELNGNATLPAVKALVESLSYGTSSNAPMLTRTVALRISDGDGGTSAPSLITIRVNPELDGAPLAHGEERVSTYKAGDQYWPTVAKLVDGGYVVAWQSTGQDGSAEGIYFQRFAANGSAIGPEVRANASTLNTQQLPYVTGLSDGGFVIVWEDSNGYDGSEWSVVAQRYGSDGLAQGGNFVVNSHTAGAQGVGRVAGYEGGFAVVWHSIGNAGGNGDDIYLKLFDNAGNVVRDEVLVSTAVGQPDLAQQGSQRVPDVSARDNGDLVIVWHDSAGNDGSGNGVFGRTWNAAQQTFSDTFLVNTTTAGAQSASDVHQDPAVAMLRDGGFVVVWPSDSNDGSGWAVMGQRFDAQGRKLGAEFLVNEATDQGQYQANVAALSTGGFVVTFFSEGFAVDDPSSRYDTYVREYDAQGVAIDNPRRLLVNTTNRQNGEAQPAIADLGNGGFVVVYADYMPVSDGGNDRWGISQQIFGDADALKRSAAPVLADVDPQVNLAEKAARRALQAIDVSVRLTDSDSTDFAGGRLDLYHVQGGSATDQLGVRHQGDGVGQIGVSGTTVRYGGLAMGTISGGANGANLVVELNGNATLPAVRALVESLGYRTSAEHGPEPITLALRISDGDGGTSTPVQVTLSLLDGALPVAGNTQVNTFTPGNQVRPSGASLTDGRFVIAWVSDGQDGSFGGIYAQMYSAGGDRIGGEFLVNSQTWGSQFAPDVVGLADGGFLVVWNDHNGSVAGQRYAADGSKRGAEFNLGTYSGYESIPATASTGDGGFVIAWSAVVGYRDGGGFEDEFGNYFPWPIEVYALLAQRFDRDGLPVGSVVSVSDWNYSSTIYPAVAALNGGGFVVAWSSPAAYQVYGSEYDVLVKVFDADGLLRHSLRVNVGSAIYQGDPAVTGLLDGGFVVTWSSWGQDVSGYWIYAQRFDAAGQPTGSEFRVNTHTGSHQYDTDVTALDGGGWVVVWYGDQSGDVFMQQYAADGSAVDGETRVSSVTADFSASPSVTSLADDGFVVAWQSYRDREDADNDGVPDAGSDTYGIRMQRFSPATPIIPDVPVDGQEDTELVLLHTVFEAAFSNNGQMLHAIKVITLPAAGTLRLDGVLVVQDQEISLADLQAGKLTYQGRLDYFGLDQFRWTGSDGSEFARTPVVTNIRLANISDGPRLEAGSDRQVQEGTWFSHNVVVSDPDSDAVLLTIDWGDGSDPHSVLVANTGAQPVDHRYADDGRYTVTVTADDRQGQPNSVVSDALQIVVENTAPSLELSGPSEVRLGQPFALQLGPVTDPGADAVIEYWIDWGDGTPAQVILVADLPAQRTVAHDYSTVGGRRIAVSIVDEDGFHQQVDALYVSVFAPPPVAVEAGPNATVVEGDPFVRTISFEDGEDSEGDGWAYTIDYGDGTVVHGRTLEPELHLNHVYEGDVGQRTVNVNVGDSPPNGSARNLVANGSFESGTYNNLDADSRPTLMLVTPGMNNLEGWQVLGSQGVHWADEGPQYASHGSRYVDLQGGSGELSRLQTTFATTPGEHYRLSFDSFRGNSGSNAATVSVGNLQNQAFLGPTWTSYPAKPVYQTFEYDFTATSSTSVLSFAVTRTDGFGPTVDNVSVTALEFESASDSFVVTVTERPTYSTSLALPTSLAPGEEGSALLSYTNISGEDQSGILVFVRAQTALLRDPLTGQYSDTLMLIGRGDGQGLMAVDESGALGFAVRQANVPNGSASITVSVADEDSPLDAAALGNALRPAFASDAAWQRVSANFVAGAGQSTQALVDALADNSALISSLGANGTSGATALAFELEQAGDFGSIAERAAAGSLGDGWAFIGDVKLDIAANGDVAWRGSTDLGALFTLNPSSAAHYIVSSSVGLSVSLGGSTSDAVPPNRPVFTKNIDGSYSADAAFGGDLVKVAGGYEVRTAGGAVLGFRSDGRLTEVVSSTGRAVEVTHDAQGRITGFGGDFNNTLTIERDGSGRATALVDEYGQTTTLGYNAGRLTQATTVAGTATFTYSAAGDLASATPAGGPATGFEYDSQGRVTAVVQAGATAATVVYDSRGGYTLTSAEGQQTQVVLQPGGIAAKVSTGGVAGSELVYDATGKLVGAQLADGSQVQFTIDDQGRLLSMTDPTGATLRYGYADDSTRPSSFTDATGTTRQFGYDANGRMVQATWGDGSSLQFNYDAQGQISGYTNRRGEATSYTYDTDGQLISRSEVSGDTTYTYDSLGRMVQATTDAGTAAARTTELAYDSANRVTRIEYPDGRSLDYGYDAAGRRTAMTDQDGNVQSYSYDTAGRLATVSYNGSQVVAYAYDGDGRLTEETNGNGTSTAYSYDARGQLTAIVNQAPDDTETSAYRYSYDIAGQRVGMQTPHGAWAYGYDAAGQLTSAQFTVNAAGTAAGLADQSLVYAYDAAGNRTSVTEDGVQTLYASNALNQYTQVGAATFTYDADGNQISKSVDGQTWTYAYNAANRLVQITGPQGEVTQYEYDMLGNRSAVVEDGVRTEFLVDPFSLGMGSAVAEYSNGQRVASTLYGLNAIGQQTGSGTYYFDGDAVGSVTSVTGTSGSIANRYVYDPFGRQLLEIESVANRLEFNGLFGVEEADAGLTYMRARFYDPEQGRFTAEDPLWATGDAPNLYRFAASNPAQLIDPEGLVPILPLAVLGARVAVAAGRATLGWAWRNKEVIGFVGLGAKVTSMFQNQALIDEELRKLDPGSEEWSQLYGDRYKQSLVDGAGIAKEGVEKYGGPIAEMAGVPGAVKNVVELVFPPSTIVSPPSTVTSPFIVAGEPGKSAASDGDPHLRTFDGLGYSFQAVGEFMLATGTGLEIQVRQSPVNGSTTVSVNAAVAMRVGDAIVGVYKDAPDPLNINGEWVQIADGETVSVGGGSVTRGGTLYIVTNPAGDGFWANVHGSHINLRPFIHSSRGSDVEGLLGNNDGNRSNDLALPDGTVLPNPVPVTLLYGQFADAWRVTDDTSLFIYGAGESTATFTNRDFPNAVVRLDDLDPVARATAEQAAIAAGLVPGTWEFNGAVLDIAMTGNAGFAAGVAQAPTAGAQPTPVVLQLPPNVVADVAATREDEAVTINALLNDSDPEGDALQIVAASDINGGTVKIVEGELLFTPAANFNGETRLRYTVADGAGNVATGVVRVAIEAVNDAPELLADQATMKPGGVLELNAAQGVLANDRDVEGDALTVVSHGAAANGTVLIAADGALRYTPNPGFLGTETIAYTVSDGLLSSIGTLTIDVANAAPVAADDAGQVTTGRAITFTAAQLLGNDRDADGDVLTLSDLGAATYGLVSWVNGQVQYASSLGFVGTDSFSYQVSDGFGGVSTAQVLVSVLPEEFSTVRLGDAPLRQTGFGGQWQAAWSNAAVTSISHKAGALDAAENWSAVRFSGAQPNLLSGLDVFQGDLGVSGQSQATSSVRQELDGTEALRIELVEEAQSASIQLARFTLNDDGSLLAEAGLLRLIDANGGVVGEQAFVANSTAGVQQVVARGASAFVAVELWAGAYDGEDFVFGARVGPDGEVVAPSTSGNVPAGSEFMLDWVEFNFPVNVIGVAVAPASLDGGP